jgi:hypothetical protein
VIPAGTITESGLEPVEVGFKLGLFEQVKALPKTSLIFHVAVPGLSSEKFNIKKPAPNFRFTMQNSLTKRIAVGYNLGAEWDGEQSGIASYVYTIAPGMEIGEKWYGYIEAFGRFFKAASPENNVDAGVAYYVTSNFKLDLSGGIGISKAAPDHYVSVGASVRFNTGKKK